MFNRPETVPYFTHSLVLCKNRLLTHCVIVSLQIIFFKISQQIAKHIPRDWRFICERRIGDQDWAAKLNWQTFYPFPRRFKTSRRFAVRFSSIPITFIWITVNFVSLNCIFTTMNHLKTGKNREEVKCEESLIYCVDVLRNSASNVDRRVCHRSDRSLQIIRYEVLYLKTRLIIISFPNILLWHLFLALSKLDFFSKMPFPPSSSVAAATRRRHFEFSTSNLKKSGWTFQVGIRKAGACASVTVSL